MVSPLALYAAKGHRAVGGWLGRLDAEIFRVLFEFQSQQALSGSVAEIGGHQGKSFTALCLGLRQSEKAYCIDVFNDERVSVRSGPGNREERERNLARFNVDLSKVVIDERLSEDVNAADIVNAVGRIRFFSIDGGPWEEIVRANLCLAEQCIEPYGIVALDDFHRPEWPEVSLGFFSWKPQRPLVAFAIGFNKLYLCEKDWAEKYQAAISNDAFVRQFRVKDTVFRGRQMPVFQEYILPEYSTKRRLLAIARVFHPDLYATLKRFLKK